MDVKSLLYVVLILLSIGIIYVSFWILVVLFIGYILYQVIKGAKDLE